ncbi:hypothetical protein PoB_007368800 [Plakobranchus ocellatus]|uniref:SGNH domain-containing protein n=1 Tax=Plakobranchus ocellatus TaxID=259542 RepID=A0AAV4DSW7_9GAST|nr:hypothetical protein PoB_007368800 [Plakobranchus ocellatus]
MCKTHDRKKARSITLDSAGDNRRNKRKADIKWGTKKSQRAIGNTGFGGTIIHPYRALCDPEGSTPCCYSNHTCVAFSQAQCVCDGCYDMRRPVHAELAAWVPRDKTCQVKVRLDQKVLARDHAKEVLELVKSYIGKPNSVLVLWMGAWDGFNSKRIINLLVKPMKKLLKGQLWPHLIWVSGHSPGLLTSPREMKNPGEVLTFNLEIEKVIDSQFPILDTFFLTEKAGVMSYDGSHYGPGLNGLKAQLLFNYLNEMRIAGNFTRKT